MPPSVSVLRRTRPIVEVWTTDRVIHRCHSAHRDAVSFNANTTGAVGRFHPFTGRGTSRVVPTLYGADLLSGALSETVFHNVPRAGLASRRRRVAESSLFRYAVSSIRPDRPLRLVSLHGTAIGRLPVAERDLIHSEADQYETTASWAQALHAALPTADGLCWRSRQDSDSLALVLFGDRVDSLDLTVVDADVAIAPGTAAYATVVAIARLAGIRGVLGV